MTAPTPPPARTPAAPVTITQYGVQNRRGDVEPLPPATTRTLAERAIEARRATTGATLRLVQRTVVTTPWTDAGPLPTPAHRPPPTAPAAPAPRHATCAHGTVLGQDTCTGCDNASRRPHAAYPVRIRPTWAGKDLLRCRRCGWHPAAAHHTDAHQHGPMPNPRTEADQ